MFMDFGFFFLLVRFVDKNKYQGNPLDLCSSFFFFFSCNSDKYHSQRKGFTLVFRLQSVIELFLLSKSLFLFLSPFPISIPSLPVTISIPPALAEISGL